MATQIHVNATDFFAGLSGRVKQIAEEEAQKTADDMLFTLRQRFAMKGGGHYPKWDPREFPETRSNEKSKESYKNWTVQHRASGEYWLMNTTTVEWNGKSVNYPNILMTGKGWSARVENGNWLRLTRGPDGGIYSTWMPKGSQFWLDYNRTEMAKRIHMRALSEGLL